MVPVMERVLHGVEVAMPNRLVEVMVSDGVVEVA